MTIEYSDYQKNIFSFIEHESGNGAVIACPGSGKTFVCAKSMLLVSSRKQVLFTCFTTVIKDDLQRKIDPNYERKNIKIQNYNGFGLAACYRGLKNLEFDRDKTENILRYVVLNNLDTKEKEKLYNQNRYNIKRIVSLAKSQLVFNAQELESKIPEYLDTFDIEIKIPESQFVDLCIQVYKECLSDQTHVDYDDQLFFPVWLDLPIRKFDVVFVDEYQDTSPVQAELINRAINNTAWGDKGRIIAIGDPNQSIYSFRACVPNIMQVFKEQYEAKELPLSICYRCSKAVVDEAHKIFPVIESSVHAKQGAVDTIETKDYLRRVTIKDLVICRTNAPLLKRCLEKISEGIPAFIKGEEGGDSLIILIEKLDPMLCKSTTELYHLINQYTINETTRLNNLGKESQAEKVKDKCDQICAVIESPQVRNSTNNTLAVIGVIKGVFTNADKVGITFMSAHKSKGLESKDDGNVYILRPELMPHPKSKNYDEELRIKYVAVTRAKNNLYYVKKEKGEK